jgi:hypothetical protein
MKRRELAVGGFVIQGLTLLSLIFSLAPMVSRAQAVTGTSPTTIVNCTVFGNCNYNASTPSESYAYGPSIAQINGQYHVFYCSRGQDTGAYSSNAWDAIRYTNSTDGINWSTPTVVLTASDFNDNSDRSACDPSWVYFNGYYYLFYSSAYVSPKGNSQTVIQVARASAISGPYLTLTTGGTWVTQPTNPKIIIKPLNDIASSYGAGEPKVIVYGGALRMWYTDDTGTGDPKTAYNPIYMLTSTDGMTWTPSVSARTTYAGGGNVEVKFDTAAQLFNLYTTAQNLDSALTDIVTATSTDGMNWSPIISLGLPNFPVPYSVIAVGVSGDVQGNIIQGASMLIGYGAPYNLTTPMSETNTVQLSLYGVTGPRFGILPIGQYILPSGVAYFSNGTGDVCSYWSALSPTLKGSATAIVSIPTATRYDGLCNGGGTLPMGQYILPSGVAYFSNGTGDVCSYWSALTPALKSGATEIVAIPYQNTYDGLCNGGGTLPVGQYNVPNGLWYQQATVNGPVCSFSTNPGWLSGFVTSIIQLPSQNTYTGGC